MRKYWSGDKITDRKVKSLKDPQLSFEMLGIK